MREISHDGFARFSKRDGGARYLRKRLHAREGQGGKEVMEDRELAGSPFIFHDEAVVVRRIDAVPNVAVADGAMKTSRKVAAGANNSPRRAANFVGVVHLFFRRRIATQILVAVLGAQ